MNINDVKPLGDKVLVKPQSKGDTTTKSGIILTDSATRGEAVWAEVVAVGEGIFTQNGARLPLSVSVGDLVMYRKDMAGTPIKIEDEEYLLFSEHELLMVTKKQN
jgi:chaperonin GroES